jgi:hypothetical protein
VGLIGLPANGLVWTPLNLTPGTYSDLVTSTLGNTATDGDDLDLRSQELAALVSDFETDVTNDTSIDNLPDGKIWQPTIGILKAILIEIDVADNTALAIGNAFDFLAATFGVWGILDALVSWIVAIIKDLIAWVRDAVNLVLSLLGLPSFGPPTEITTL